ncbi:MAG: hypothetical protein WD066_02010 [Planctomycetaceae bacterium]
MDEKLDRIVETLALVNANLEAARVSLSALVQTAEDHERRLRAIERWKHNLTPILAIATFLLGAVVTEFVKRLG